METGMLNLGFPRPEAIFEAGAQFHPLQGWPAPERTLDSLRLIDGIGPVIQSFDATTSMYGDGKRHGKAGIAGTDSCRSGGDRVLISICASADDSADRVFALGALAAGRTGGLQDSKTAGDRSSLRSSVSAGPVLPIVCRRSRCRREKLRAPRSQSPGGRAAPLSWCSRGSQKGGHRSGTESGGGAPFRPVHTAILIQGC